MVFMQHRGQGQKCCRKLLFSGSFAYDSVIVVFLTVIASAAVSKFRMPVELIFDYLGKQIVCGLPGHAFYILECDVYHWVFSLSLSVFPAAFPDVPVSEENRGVFIAFFEESSEHFHGQRLAKASWSCE